MENLRTILKQIAYTPPSKRLSTFSPLQLSIIPFLSFASTVYKFAISIRHRLYHYKFFAKHRLPVPVISVGNLTWGGNGKTPMVEFLARWLADAGISPLILTRGYGGADEAKMLQRHLQGIPAKIGIGANRAATAARFFEKYDFINLHGGKCFRRIFPSEETKNIPNSDQIGAAILDDGMQHLSLWRDLEIVMVNGMMPWGNCQLLPLGPLREPLEELDRADIVVIHHADLVPNRELEALESSIRNVKQSMPTFFTKMAASHFVRAGNMHYKMPLKVADDLVVLCVSGIGSSDSFVQRIQQIGPRYVDRLDFSDHHAFGSEDIEVVRTRLRALESHFVAKPAVIITEKDYDRAPEVFKLMEPYEVLVLCSRLQFLIHEGRTEDSFKKLVMQHLEQDSDT